VSEQVALKRKTRKHRAPERASTQVTEAIVKPTRARARAGRLRLRDVVGSAPLAWGLLVVLVVWSGALAYSARLSPTYEGVAVVSFAPRDAVTTGAETMVLVVPKYVELLSSPTVLDRAARQLGVDPDVVRDRSTGVIQPNTLNLRIAGREGDPVAAADTAAVLAAGVVQAAASDPLVSAELVAPAVADPRPVAPTPGQVRLLGLALGVAAGLLMALILARRRPGWQELWGTSRDPSPVLGSPGDIRPSRA
jgi:capsular polysaccharide biosynthesis protein